MEELVKKGLVKNIGVSNAPCLSVLDMLAYCEIKPVTNQVELHPYFVRKEFQDFHDKWNINVTAYAPIGANAFPLKSDEQKKMSIFEDSVINELAKKHAKSPA